jgi:hypothetical protein
VDNKEQLQFLMDEFLHNSARVVPIFFILFLFYLPSKVGLLERAIGGWRGCPCDDCQRQITR